MASVAALARQVRQMRATLARTGATMASPVLRAIRQDPTAVLTSAGMTPDPWQQTLLTSTARRTLLLCSRQAGKSTLAAALALLVALLNPGALIVLVAPTERQSKELLRKCAELFNALGRPVPLVNPRGSALVMEFTTGSRILALPGSEPTVRGFSGAALLVIDEAARVSDALYYAVRPMLAVSRGRLIALTTAFGARGWFHKEWAGKARWHRVKATAEQCPRITADFLREEREALGPRWYAQEYECSFEDAVGAVFAQADIDAALCDDVTPLTL